MPVAIIGGLIAGAGAIGGALISSHATSSAANTAAQTAASDNALQEQIYNSNKALAQPYINAGNSAEDELSGFLGLGGDPAKINSAFNTYLNSTGYQFNRDQGLDAVTQSKAVSGLLDSGSAVKALDAYGTGLADQYGQQYVGNLQGLTGAGENAVNALTGAGQAFANASNSNSNSAANVAAGADVANANITTNAINQAVNAFGKFAGGSSFGSPSSGGANAFAQPGVFDV